MRKEVIETGKTVDAAIETACAKLGYDREQCEFEIIDLPKKAFLGLKTIPAKVRVYIDLPDEKPAAPKVERPQPRPEPRMVQEKEKQPEPKPQRRPASPAVPAIAAPVAEARQPEPEADLSEPERIPVTGDFTQKETAALQYIDGILKEFGLTADLKLSRDGSGIYIEITGDGLGTIIGRRGETLDAIQYLTGLVANRLEGDYLRVTVDCGDYRSKRKDTLEALAKKLAAQVLKTNVSKTLEPMNPFERRVIHATVSKIEGVTSSSIGEEPNRRVVITTPTARRPSAKTGRGDRGDRGDRERDGDRRGRGGRDRNDRGERRDRGDRGDRGRRPRSGGRPTAPQTPPGPPKETPESAAMGNTPIGKLDLE